MEIAIAKDVQAEEREDPTREGLIKRKWLLTGGAEDGLNFRLFRSQYQEGEKAFQSPRHHHAFQQIRWAESGSINFGPDQFIAEGDIAYFPRGAKYGPQLKDQGVSWLLQFGFGAELPGGKSAMDRYRADIEKLKGRGRIEDGIFVDIDPSTGNERRRNPAEVLAEDEAGTRAAVRPERYAAPILMHTRAFDYYTVAPGVEMKRLGCFFDHCGPNSDVRISMLRFAKKTTFSLAPERAQLLWNTSGSLEVHGHAYPALTCLYSPRGEQLSLSTPDGFEAITIEFPHLD